MSTVGYSAVVDDDQAARLDQAHRNHLAAEKAVEVARAAQQAVVIALARRGYGATAMAHALNVEPHPWRAVHRTTVQRVLDPVADLPPAPVGYHARGQRLDDIDAAELRAAHLALYDAGRAADAALDARDAVFVALHDEGVLAPEQARHIGVSPNTVRAPVQREERRAGRPRRSHRRA